MKTKAVRLYGKNDLRLEEFELPPIKDDEILAQIISDSICMSSYKAAIQGEDHKRVPKDVSQNPVIIGHEFCGIILEVGDKWKHKFKPGMKFSIQPALNLKENPYAAPGYSFKYIGGSATHIIIPNEVMEQGCLLEYNGDAFFYGSLSEPMSCIIGAFKANYHTESGKYEHKMGIKEGGNMAILAGVGPMGLGAIDYALHADRKPKRLVVTDIDEARIKRAESLYRAEEARKNGVELIYVNTGTVSDPVKYLLDLTGGEGYDDVFVFAPVKAVVEQADKILAKDGCLNFFAGPTNPNFSAELNFYNVHYNSTHIVGTSGGNTEDMIDALRLMSEGRINPASMITHIGGLDCVVETTLHLPEIPGGKKLIYTNISMELTAISDFRKKGETSPLFAALADIVEKNNGLWCLEAERYLLENADKI
ncbi:alcohol dehydrogenase, zinc-binding domain protein [Thermoclostridium stercorarium subsp. stercorarium DSM 8532]|jgi:threonine dehydrogenase-like Zn-dependent dehydrogenase|uniref:Alcohol dehydrogenase, zinc-binding domain protein n=3 Tax=Thermoclostridium stercorarium TaxID=1510 RepID=L7VN12_THES1|nr:zinc-binding dehydrogenase [Thermoclostridium stercorarium]AGC67861.1 alcohol dehydrogenase, zinc-binding domain protein [Thermoclostridium stercorarium subsp. stercorarium DSM 8532]AGI38902.1 Adh [Thermoclostridium stercorarium subsp. stercorarium DSM 8532]ANW98273.1 L-sorbose 1-phosphate reductase [Thermoclostridium stercorarium subsp. thermolacticum DSM 2910]ANX00797.1 L-sorbose 1-phosphate reductase [Thermoclostridium stercorarium subsp. leptospartum DSM 9219]UZQ86412.1 zinc-binding deh